MFCRSRFLQWEEANCYGLPAGRGSYRIFNTKEFPNHRQPEHKQTLAAIIMRRASEASLLFLGFPRKKKPLHNGSHEHRMPKIKNKTFFCTRDVCV